MKKLKVFAVLGGITLLSNISIAQEPCASYLNIKALAAKDPSLLEREEQYREKSRQVAEAYIKELNNSAAKSTAEPPTIPVVFHVMLTSSQISAIGGTQGIYNRIAAQIEALNADYTGTNSDISKVPSGFSSVLGNPNIKFGVAHVKPDGSGTTGVEIKTITVPSYESQSDDSIKHSFNGGMDPWDESKYINIWVVNITAGSSSQVLGYSYSPGYASMMGQPSGIVLHYGSFGVKNAANSGQFWAQSTVKGRTLTHEMGHYFDIWHIWGDDGGKCPTQAGGKDDGITDTPPQADKNQSTSPSYPHFDACTPGGNGVMFMNYMDYVNENSMYMFTKQQALHMQAQIAKNGPSYSLTQNSNLLSWPTNIATMERDNGFDVFPNPSSGAITISLSKETKSLKHINVISIMGNVVRQIPVTSQTLYNVDLSSLNKGVYIVQCQFEEGTVTRKIVLQ